MSKINLKHFVDIDIQQHISETIPGIRDTVVLFTPDELVSGSATTRLFSNISEVTYSKDSLTYKYLEMYFANGGIKALVYEGVAYTDLTIDKIKALDDKYIYFVQAVELANRTAAYTALKSVIDEYNNLVVNGKKAVYGINEKLLITALPTIEEDKSSIKNLIVKYSSQLGGEMTVAAYLSQIDVDGIDTIKDYAFTQESIKAEDLNDTEYSTLIDNNINVDINLTGTIRNCGGNCKNGDDIVNNFVRIILHQTLTNSLIALLNQKIKSTTGISKMYAVTAQELEKYKTCGYLTTDKVWKDKDLKVTGADGITYTIINKGDALTNGYVVKILPQSALSSSDKAVRNAPPIYVVIADQYSIRKITIKGEII